MQEKVERLESKVSELTFEMRTIVTTQKDIADTLREFKNINVNIALMRKDLETQTKSVDRAFKEIRTLQVRMDAVEKNDVAQGIKLGGAERGLWVFVTAAVGTAMAFFKEG